MIFPLHSFISYYSKWKRKKKPFREEERRSNTNSGNKLSTRALPTSAITKRPHKNFDNGNGYEPFIISTSKEESSLMDNGHGNHFMIYLRPYAFAIYREMGMGKTFFFFLPLVGRKL